MPPDIVQPHRPVIADEDFQPLESHRSAIFVLAGGDGVGISQDLWEDHLQNLWRELLQVAQVAGSGRLSNHVSWKSRSSLEHAFGAHCAQQPHATALWLGHILHRRPS